MPYQYVRETLKDGGKPTARLHDACQIALKIPCQIPANLTRTRASMQQLAYSSRFPAASALARSTASSFVSALLARSTQAVRFSSAF
jgi:hypothetical protein